MEKDLPPIPAKRYFTIGEVADLCGLKPHVLRYWEQEFTQLRPMKRRGNRRYYQHHEVLMIRRIREWSNLPIIVLSARSEDSDKIEALDQGADDYLTKPFSVDELLARLRVTQRRLNLQASGEVSSSVFVNGPLKIDFAAGCVWLNDEELHLTPIEYKLLCVLAHNVGKVLTHTAITQKVWGSSQENDIASLRVYMASLRKKLESGAHSLHLVQTHVGVGYRMLRVEADDSPEE